MKKWWITLIAALSACIGAGAQTRDDGILLAPLEGEVSADILQPSEAPLRSRRKPEWHHGVSVGYLGSSAKFVTQSGRQTVRYRSGFTAGWSLTMPFGEVWSFDTGAMLSLWRFRHETAALKISDRRYMIEVPLTLTFFESDAYFPIFLQAGFLTGVCVGGSQSATTYDTDKRWIQPDAVFPRISFGLVFGIGYKNITVQFINNFTGTWSREMSYRWESFTENTINRQTPRAINVLYTYWF